MADQSPTTTGSSPARASRPTSDDTAVTELLSPLQPGDSTAAAAASEAPAGGAYAVGSDDAHAGAPASAREQAGPVARPGSARRPRALSGPFGESGERSAGVILVALVAIAVGFIVMLFVTVTSQSINALAVVVAAIASMVAAYYGITLSIQQVKYERAEKQKATERADAATTTSRETEVWAAQMESGLRVAMAKLNAAGIDTTEVTKAAGTPDDFF